MKTRTRKLLALLPLIIGSFSTVTFADQACTTCSSTSPILEQYIKFSTEVIQTLETIANEKKSAQGNGGTVLDHIAQNLNDKQQTALTFTVLVGTIGTQLVGTTTREELQVMTNAKALTRDRQKLDQLDQKISRTLFDLGQAGAYVSNIQDYQVRIGKIFDTYSKQPDSFLKKTGEPTGTAATIISALRHMNQAYKEFIAGGKTDGFDAFSETYNQDLGIVLSPVNYNELVEQYDCARGFNKCDTTYKNFGQNMSSITDNAQKQTKKAVDTIKVSLQRLKCAFAKESNLQCAQLGFTDRQNNLLRGLYGIEGPMANKKGSSALANSMTRLGDSLAAQIHDVKDFYTKNDNPATTVLPAKTTSLDIVSPDMITQRAAAGLSAQLSDTINETLGASKSSWQQHVLADPLVVTRKMPANTIMLYSTINIIGDAQTQKTLLQNLVKACENQCTNLPGVCNY